MTKPVVVSDQQWLDARLELMQKEKAHTRARDELTAARMAMPWRKIDKNYGFQGVDGGLGLAELFGPHTQLILQHFMFEADWQAGCKGCSLMADSLSPVVPHLAQRDVAVAAVSIAPLASLLAFKDRMGWQFQWVSSAGSEFNRDFQVTLDKAEWERGEAEYNLATSSSPHAGEVPGVSVFAKDNSGQIYHTYSCYARGLEATMGVYNFLDLVPKGRDESALSYGMEWLALKDTYNSAG